MLDPAIARFANDAFYIAVNAGDFDALERLWSTSADVSCVHPGWNPLTDREDILASWRGILEGGNLKITCHAPRVLYQGNVVSVICFEQLDDNWLAATNNFIMEDGELRLVHHQASQCVNVPELDASGQESIQ